MDRKKTSAHKLTRQTIDWGDVHRRMEATTAEIEKGTLLSPEEKKAILKARAAILAQEQNEEKIIRESIDVLEFFLAEESYGIETLFIREICPLKQLTPLPGTPPFVLGVTNMRGEIISVIDIKRFLGLPETQLTTHDKIIIVRDEEMEFGILANNISSVNSIPLDTMQSSLPTLSGVGADYFKGITSTRMMILDAAKILSDKKLVNEDLEM